MFYSILLTMQWILYNLENTMQTLKGLKIISKKVKKVSLRQLTQPIVKGLSDLVQWGSMLISKVKAFPLKVYSLLVSITKRLSTLKNLRWKHLKNSLIVGVKLLTFLTLVLGMLIFLLLPLMLVVVSYAVVRHRQ